VAALQNMVCCMDINVFLPFALQLADTAHAILSKAGGVRPLEQVKPDRSFVTSLDGEIEQVLRDLIIKKYPTHGILGEELGSINLENDLVWVLDPIDGTAPFIAGVPVYGTLIALCYKTKPVIGIIDMAATNDRWVGVKGKATTHTSGQISAVVQTRKIETLSSAILTTSNPDFYANEERPALEALKAVTAWRIYGGCCMSYGLLASGRTDVAIDTRFQIYDYAPFVPIIEGAGGVITDWEGRELTLHSGHRVLAAGNAARHSEALALVKAAIHGD
jgi:inositol-phosphate phosphatase / L-galactose 1-phosphate phosphatase / histidinol-phosphatase